MEAFGGNNFDEEWQSLSLSGLFTCEDSNDPFLVHCNVNNSFPNYADSFMVSDGANVASVGILDPNFYCNISQESSNSTESDQAVAFVENIHHQMVKGVDFHHNVIMDNHTFVEPMGFRNLDNRNASAVVPIFPDGMMEEEDILQLRSAIFCSDDQFGNAESAGEIQVKRKCESETPPSHDNSSDHTAKKRPRIPRDVAQKSKRNSKSKRDKKPAIHPSNDDDEIINTQSASACSSEDDSNGGSTSKSEGRYALNLNGKAKTTSRGAATDPQSLYARKRRERINERLKILQNLVPNGTKVDISTMLEEAAHYVKFLQLQIKLLSSDDLWMYAPIAYNGMDIGLYQKIVPRRC